VFTHVSRPATHPLTAAWKAGARLRRLAAALAAATCGPLASAAAIPAAFAGVLPPRPDVGFTPVTPVPVTTVRVVTAGGMAG
jgi:hypothetical protein